MLVAAHGARARHTCCIAISAVSMNVITGQAEISTLSSPYPAPKAMFAPIVAPMPTRHDLGSRGASWQLRAGAAQGKQRPGSSVAERLPGRTNFQKASTSGEVAS
jgi:hypothetical protein